MKLVKFNSLDGMNGLNFTNVFRCISQLKTSFPTLFLVISLFLVSCGDKPLKTGYININQINKEYKLAIQYDTYIKELEKEVALRLVSIKTEINGLEEKIQALNEKNESISQDLLQKFYTLQQQYVFQENKVRKEIQDSVDVYREKLNTQVNKHVYDYAEKNDFHYVYSPAGTGTFMYADSNLNITKEVIYYLNSR